MIALCVVLIYLRIPSLKKGYLFLNIIIISIDRLKHYVIL